MRRVSRTQRRFWRKYLRAWRDVGVRFALDWVRADMEDAVRQGLADYLADQSRLVPYTPGIPFGVSIVGRIEP